MPAIPKKAPRTGKHAVERCNSRGGRRIFPRGLAGNGCFPGPTPPRRSDPVLSPAWSGSLDTAPMAEAQLLLEECVQALLLAFPTEPQQLVGFRVAPPSETSAGA
jgi:hypothetical protein